MAAFDHVELPRAWVAYGSASGPGHNTQITEMPESGRRESVGFWPGPLHRLVIQVEKRTPAQLAELREFVIARQGALRGFLCKDHGDFTSAVDRVSAPAFDDEQIGVGDGTTTQFQLIKTYTSGLSSITRIIEKPVEDTVLIGVNGVALEIDTDYSVDDTTGVVTLVSPPTAGHAVTAGFQHLVPVQFDKSVDEWLACTREEPEELSVRSIEMIEIVNPSRVNMDRHYGGAYEAVIAGDLTLSLLLAQTYILSGATSGLSVRLPNPTNLPTGKDLFAVINGGAEDLDILDHNGSTLTTISTDEGVDVHLSEDGVGGKTWYVM